MTQAYKIIEHRYDAVIVGVGGGGLRAAIGQPLLSPQIKDLEGEVGAALFHRLAPFPDAICPPTTMKIRELGTQSAGEPKIPGQTQTMTL